MIKTSEMTDSEFEAYKKISSRIRELESYISKMNKEIQIKPVRQKIEEAEKMLSANTHLMFFLFGEGNLHQ